MWTFWRRRLTRLKDPQRQLRTSLTHGFPLASHGWQATTRLQLVQTTVHLTTDVAPPKITLSEIERLTGQRIAG